MSKIHECERDYDCEFCGSKKGHACVRKNGKVATYPHMARINAEFEELKKTGQVRVYGLNITRQ